MEIVIILLFLILLAVLSLHPDSGELFRGCSEVCFQGGVHRSAAYYRCVRIFSFRGI